MKNKLKNIVFFILILQTLTLKNDLLAQSREPLIKAGFIEKFTHFIQWPEASEGFNTTNLFVIKVIGENPFGSVLEELFSSVKVQKQEVKVEYISTIEEIGSCNILFISGSEKENLSKILEYTTGKPILTIGDSNGFGSKGVEINLFNEENYIRYEVNKSAIEKSVLNINSLLLSYAVIIETNGQN
ncbi:MAG: YfiR family protein [Prolixibacteraceae bacterium]|nr:YfiR family protein [Prolixibacteraceae bacterium]